MSSEKKRSNVLIFVLLAVVLLGWVLGSGAATEGAKKGIQTCLTLIVPTLFPFFVLSDLTVSTGFAAWVGHLLEKPIRVLFRLPGVCAVPLLLGGISGFPVGAKAAAQLYGQGLCSREDAEKLLAFCSNPGIAFVLSTVGGGMWGNAGIGVMLWGIQSVCSLGIGLVLCRRRTQKKFTDSVAASEPVFRPFSSLFPQAVKNSAVTVLSVCSYVVLFSALNGMLDAMRLWDALCGCFSFLPPAIVRGVSSGVLEMTTGLLSLNHAQPDAIRLAVTAVLLGWSGLSVHAQIRSAVAGSGISCRFLLPCKAVQSALSGAVAFSLAGLPGTIPAFFVLPDFRFIPGFYASVFSALSLLLFFCLFSAKYLPKKH